MSLPPEETAQRPVAQPAPAESSYRGYSQWPRYYPSLIKPSQVRETTTKRDQDNSSASKTKNSQVTQVDQLSYTLFSYFYAYFVGRYAYARMLRST